MICWMFLISCQSVTGCSNRNSCLKTSNNLFYDVEHDNDKVIMEGSGTVFRYQIKAGRFRNGL